LSLINGYKITGKLPIGIDFDSVIHSYEKGYYDGTIYGTVIKNTRESINKLRKNYEIVIMTARQPISEIKRWLKENNVYFDKITNEKIICKHYIDDNSIRFINWKNTLKLIENENL